MDRIKKLGPQTDGGKEAEIAVKKSNSLSCIRSNKSTENAF